MAQLRFLLQEPEVEEETELRTLLLADFLRVKMDGGDGRIGWRKSLQERLRWKGMGCCGATWGGFRPSADDQHRPEQPEEDEILDLGESPAEMIPDCAGAGSRMNLAAALAAEREMRDAEESTSNSAAAPARMSLMRLLEETAEEGDGEEVGSDRVCCVCMGRKKGAAFIPCGHTFCRVCSREVWIQRGSCPICNRMIIQILDIF